MSTLTPTAYLVNVWFGAEPTAAVSEEFQDAASAQAFADSYASYKTARAVVFAPLDMREPAPPQDWLTRWENNRDDFDL